MQEKSLPISDVWNLILTSSDYLDDWPPDMLGDNYLEWIAVDEYKFFDVELLVILILSLLPTISLFNKSVDTAL